MCYGLGMKTTAQLTWIENLPEAGPRVWSCMQYEAQLLAQRAELQRQIRALDTDIKRCREESERFVAGHWTAEEIAAAKNHSVT